MTMTLDTRNSPGRKSHLEEEAISRMKKAPVTAKSRLAFLLGSGKDPSRFNLVPSDKTLNAKLIDACGISSSLHQNKEIYLRIGLI